MGTPPQVANSSGLVPRVIRRFRGLQMYKSATLTPAEWATDLINVICNASGNLSKLRYPVVKSADLGPWASGSVYDIDTIFDFQQANGNREMVFGSGLGFGTWGVGLAGDWGITKIIEDGTSYGGRINYVDSNNLLFLATGKAMKKYEGQAVAPFSWGIAAPTVAPALGLRMPIINIQRTTNVVTVNFDFTGLPSTAGQAVNGVHGNQMNGTRVNDTILIDSCTDDPTLQGSFPISVVGGTTQVKYAQTGPDTGLLSTHPGFITIYTIDCGGAASSIAQYARKNNVAYINFSNNYRILPGEIVVVAGLAGSGAPLNGTWKTIPIAANDPIATSNLSGWIAFVQIGPDIAVTAGGARPPTCVGGFTDQLGPRLWAYSYKRSSTGEESSRSPFSTFVPTSGGSGLVSNVRAYLTATAPTDPQVDTIVWYGTLDGGGDFFKIAEFPLSNGLFFGDGSADDLLDKATRASLINNPPPVGSYVGKFHGRIFVAGIVGAPQDIAYSGYEKILVGRPESSFPPNNRLRLAIGADALRAFGAIPDGIVAWSYSDEMFVFKGVVEDIVISGQVNFSAYLKQLPWRTGATSHYAVQSSPYGVIFRSTDQSIKFWNGVLGDELVGPKTVSDSILPLLKRITPGTEPNEQSAFFNWQDRDWYALLIAIDGSTAYNRLLFVDMNPNAEENVGIFVTDIACTAIGVREDTQGQKHLIITKDRKAWELKVTSTAVNGINRVKTQTTTQLFAFWQGGFDGNDSPMVTKFYRYGKLVTDQDGFSLIARVFDDENFRLRDEPNQMWEKKMNAKNKGLSRGGAFDISRRGRRLQMTIQFPDADCDANVLELTTSYSPIAEFHR